MQELNYRQRPEVSQSLLKRVGFSPDCLMWDDPHERSESAHFSIGSALDVALARGLTVLKNRVVTIENRPSGMLYKIVDYLINNQLEDIDENILSAREELQVFPTWKDATIVSKYHNEIKWYYDIVANLRDGNIILTEEEMYKVLRMHQSLTTNTYTKKYFQKSDTVNILNHVPVYFKYKGVGCKAEIDQLNIDMVNRTILPIDFKSTGDITRLFPNAVKKYRYDIQAACYTKAIEELIHGDADCSLINFDVSDFRILPFTFLVETTLDSKIGIAPLPFIATPEMLNAGMYGVYPINKHMVTGPAASKYFQVYTLKPGFDGLIEEYIFQMSRPKEERRYTRQEINELEGLGAIPLSPW